MKRGAGGVPPTPPWHLGAALLGGWETLEPAQHWQTPIPGRLPHPRDTSRDTLRLQSPPPRDAAGRVKGDSLRCSPFLCLIAKSGLEERGEVRAWTSCTHGCSPRGCHLLCRDSGRRWWQRRGWWGRRGHGRRQLRRLALELQLLLEQPHCNGVQLVLVPLGA